MKPSHTHRKKHSAHAPQVPYWYYVVLAATAVVGILLITLSSLQRVNTQGLTTDGDYFKGNPNAATTIIDWGNFG